jgi:decaprenylphospho-beta-D-erythro-pentofuranosid-2-ulose 2-reductase
VKHVALVGATEGIGRALAAEYLRRGWRVGLVGRDPAKNERVRRELQAAEPLGMVVTAVCDVEDRERIAPAFEEILGALGQIDLFVYCAGAMPPYGETLEERVASIGLTVEVNVTGALRFLEVAADYLEATGRGRLAAIGSTAGERGRKGHPVYGASKAALHQYLEGLRARLHGTGVGVTTIKPGWVRTRMLPPGPAGSPLAIGPDRAARSIARGLERGRDSFFVPRWWGVLAIGLRLLPRPLFKRFAPP